MIMDTNSSGRRKTAQHDFDVFYRCLRHRDKTPEDRDLMMRRAEDGNYVDAHTQEAWLVWAAALDSARCSLVSGEASPDGTEPARRVGWPGTPRGHRTAASTAPTPRPAVEFARQRHRPWMVEVRLFGRPTPLYPNEVCQLREALNALDASAGPVP